MVGGFEIREDLPRAVDPILLLEASDLGKSRVEERLNDILHGGVQLHELLGPQEHIDVEHVLQTHTTHKQPLV